MQITAVDAAALQSLYRSNQKPVDSAHRVTPTLIALIVLFTILVTPSNVITFVRTAAPGAYRTFETAAKLANFFLLSNFAVNFVLYLVINAEFRRVTRDLVTCRCGSTGSGQGDAARSAASVGRSQRWRPEAGGHRRALQDDEMRDDYNRVAVCGDHRTDTSRRIPVEIVVTEDTNVNFSETEIAL